MNRSRWIVMVVRGTALCMLALAVVFAFVRPQGDAAAPSDAPSAASADTPAQQQGRQMALFLDLVYDEYHEGVQNGQIVHQEEYDEAVAFLAQAQTLYGLLRPALAAADSTGAERLAAILTGLDTTLRTHGNPAEVQTAVQEATDILRRALGLESEPVAGESAASSEAAFAAIDARLDYMLSEAEEGHYDKAEQARLEAYGLYESGPELHLANRAPVLSREIEARFWEGSGNEPGLYTLVAQKASVAALQTAVDALRIEMKEARTFLEGGLTTPLAVLNSAGIIVREGLEAVLIIGAILAYLLKTGAQQRYVAWVFAGVGAAVVFSVVMWFAAQTFLTITPAQRELFEGITSLIAVAVLFYVTNWLFHKVYVVDWIKYVREQADKALSNGRALGLAALGFTVVFREGLETVLFYQALLFDADPAPVALGFVAGLAVILVVAFLILRLSRRLPLKPLFAVTTVLLLVLAFSFTGAGVRELQEAGAIHTTLLPWFPENLVMMELFGLFPTLETLLAQTLFAALIGFTFAYSRWQGLRAATTSARQATQP